jgi:hypothetical protein
MAATCGEHAEYHVAPQQSDNQQGGPLPMIVARLAEFCAISTTNHALCFFLGG